MLLAAEEALTHFPYINHIAGKTTASWTILQVFVGLTMKPSTS